METDLHLAQGWEAGLERAAGCRRVVVLGPTDSGKSSFIRALAGRVPGLALLDLDPGQKMVGPPGSASLGRFAPELRLERFVFLGSTAIGGFNRLADAALTLSRSAGGPVAVNTSGYVAGPGARLQRLTIDALAPDLVVAIAAAGALDSVLPDHLPVVRLERSPLARPKTPKRRREARRAALDSALAGAGTILLARGEIVFEPAEPSPLDGPERPVCARADAMGEDMAIAILVAVESDRVRLLGPAPPRPVRHIRLGRMWSRFDDEQAILLDRLAPAWKDE